MKRHARAVATTLAQAFAEDPFFAFILPNARHRHRSLLRIFEGSRRHCERVGGVALRREGKAAALWSTKHTMEIGFVDGVRAGMFWLPFQIGLGSAGRLGTADHEALAFLSAQVPEPFAYLMAVGVDGSLRGQGEGRAVIADVEAAAAAHHRTLTLKTENPDNVPLYEHLGFAVRGHAVMPRSRLPTWVMSKPIGAHG